MSITGFCASDDHDGCPDSKQDKQVCDCSCHLGVKKQPYDRLEREIDKQARKFIKAWRRIEDS
jgi:hypothetical protein